MAAGLEWVDVETGGPPAALGFRLPAQWEPHEATWIGWPHQRGDWPGKLTPVKWVYTEIVRKLAPGESVRILVQSTSQENEARRMLGRADVELSRVEFFRWPTDRGWLRDSGACFVKRSGRGSGPGEVAISRFRFNAWAKYPNWQRDDQIPVHVAERFGLRLFPMRAADRDVILEGGSIDGNGRGTLLTTEECLLDPVVQPRNPHLTRSEVERVLADGLGAPNVIWLGRGISGDDTHGHVDDLCRFVGPRTVVLCQEENPADANYGPLRENRERLESALLEDGSRPEVVALPMPAPLTFAGQRLPATYANFYIANAAVLVPTFNDPNDRKALGILSELITDRPVVGIHAVDLIWGLGALHCLTREQPAV